MRRLLEAMRTARAVLELACTAGLLVASVVALPWLLGWLAWQWWRARR